MEQVRLCVLCFQSTNEAVFAVEFNPSDSTNIITCGKSHVYFWTLSSGQFTKKQGIFGVGQSVLTRVILLSFVHMQAQQNLQMSSVWGQKRKLWTIQSKLNSPTQTWITVLEPQLWYSFDIPEFLNRWHAFESICPDIFSSCCSL